MAWEIAFGDSFTFPEPQHSELFSPVTPLCPRANRWRGTESHSKRTSRDGPRAQRERGAISSFSFEEMQGALPSRSPPPEPRLDFRSPSTRQAHRNQPETPSTWVSGQHEQMKRIKERMVAWESNLQTWKDQEEKRARERSQLLDERAARFNAFLQQEEARLSQERRNLAMKQGVSSPDFRGTRVKLDQPRVSDLLKKYNTGTLGKGALTEWKKVQERERLDGMEKDLLECHKQMEKTRAEQELWLAEQKKELQARDRELAEALEEAQADIALREQRLEEGNEQLAEERRKLTEWMRLLEKQEQSLSHREREVESREQHLARYLGSFS